MRLRLSNPDLVPELLQFLESRTDVVTQQVSDNEVELSLLGSYNEDAAQMTVDLLVRSWPTGMTERPSTSSTEQMTWPRRTDLGAAVRVAELLAVRVAELLAERAA
jgi:hypothetical protein